MMLGRELDTHALQRAGRTLLSDKPVAAFSGFGKKGTIAPFDLQVRPGEIVGLAGLLGSGRTETAEAIFGIKPADSGSALIKGKQQTLRSPHQASCLGIVSVRRIAKRMALLPPLRCGKTSFWHCRHSAAGCGLSHGKNKTRLPQRFIRQLGIRTPNAEQPIDSPAVISKKYCSRAGY